MLDWAKYYARLGIRVFPVKERLKKPPLLDGWPQEATNDAGKLAEWWKDWPGANIGVATGSSGLVDIETDIKPDAIGEESLAAWAEGQGFTLPDTWSFRSGGGGIHRLFRCENPNVHSRVGVLPAVDVRAAGGYAVFPPSIHPNGTRYEWLPGHAPADMPDGPAIIPYELFCLLTEDQTGSKPPLEVPEEIGEGCRNDTLFRLACKLRRDGLGEDEILGAVQVMNENRCSPPLEDSEIAVICRQAAKYKAGELPKDTAPAEQVIKTAADFGKLNIDFIWYPYFPLEDYSVMMADGGTGKTIICCGIAAAVTTGKPLPGEDFSGNPRNVLIISGEDRGELLKARLAASGADLKRVYILDCLDSEGLNFTDKYDEFKAIIQKCSPALVIVDPWHGFVGPGININQINELRPVLQKLGILAKSCNCALLLISHVNKRAQGENANNAATGSNDLINAARAAVRIIFDEEDEDCRLMVHTKANYSRYGPTVRYRITEGGGVLWEGFSDITRATLEKAARSRSTPGEVQQAAHEKDRTRENLIYALKHSVDDDKPAKYTYVEFEEKWGGAIFGGGQAKRALDSVKAQLTTEGFFLKTGIQIRRNKKNNNGFLIQRHETPTV